MNTTYHSKNSKQKPVDQLAVGEEESLKIIAAITEGKYSLACARILRAKGYEPGDYMPYRTYIRLAKESY